MKIKLDTNLGAIALAISAVMQEDKLEAAALLAMRYLVFHKAPSVAYKKDSGLKRDSKFSPELQAGIESAVKTALGGCFSEIAIVASEKLDSESAATKLRRGIWENLKAIEVDEAKLRTEFPEFYPVEEIADDESVG